MSAEPESGFHQITSLGQDYLEWLVNQRRSRLVQIFYDQTDRTATQLMKLSRGELVLAIVRSEYISSRFLKETGRVK